MGEPATPRIFNHTLIQGGKLDVEKFKVCSNRTNSLVGWFELCDTVGEILENDKSYAIFSRFRIFSSLEILFVRFLYRLDIYLVFFDLLNECSKYTRSACSRFKTRSAFCCSRVGPGSSLF